MRPKSELQEALLAPAKARVNPLRHSVYIFRPPPRDYSITQLQSQFESAVHGIDQTTAAHNSLACIADCSKDRSRLTAGSGQQACGRRVLG